jgi:histone deacetylase 8
MSERVAWIHSSRLADLSARLPVHRRRSHLLASLLHATGIAALCTPLDATQATRAELLEAHDDAYVDVLLATDRSADDSVDSNDERFGLAFDTARFDGLAEYVSLVAGASLRGARALIRDEARIAMCFDGGRHHAMRDRASGYCFVNDCVLAILELRTVFERVLYVDIDVHHGDGVEDAFAALSSVFTLSLHHRAPGFFPGSGDEAFVGTGRGLGFTKNVVLPRGTDDAAFLAAFEAALSEVLAAFEPRAVVLQCGCDGMRNDPLGAWHLSAAALVRCVRRVVRLGLPTLVLGGGGYVDARAAKAFCRVAAACVNVTVPDTIPSDCEHFEEFGPEFLLRAAGGGDRSDDDDNNTG